MRSFEKIMFSKNGGGGRSALSDRKKNLYAVFRRWFSGMKLPPWLNRTVIGAGIASFFGNLGYEAVTVLLPSFLILLGAPVYALGIIEGLSDGASSFVSFFSGYFADKLGKRREFTLIGSVATAIFPAFLAVGASWFVVLGGRLIGWIGRGIRSPSRDAILSKAVDKKDLGKAFGFHRAGDTLGAVARAGRCLFPHIHDANPHYLLAYSDPGISRPRCSMALPPGEESRSFSPTLSRSRHPSRDSRRGSNYSSVPSSFSVLLISRTPSSSRSRLSSSPRRSGS